ncbi:MAG TPA: hypothetical protein PKO36_03710 [Candidatus Hydrogenedentes bacterium]|nr:hypothetical protein [Candidatus Hydrogenedentota bacterium]
MTKGCDRRTFLKTAAVLAAWGTTREALGRTVSDGLSVLPGPKKPGRVRGAFFYPPEQVVLDGKCEDGWSKENWFTWPGNQYKPEEQQAKFMSRLNGMAKGLDLECAIDAAPIYTDAAIQGFISDIAASKPDALILFNFWNSFSAKMVPILDAYPGPIILYHPVGSNHQLPPARFRTAKRVQYIHSIEHWDALERGLRAIHAKVRMRQSRLLRVSGRLQTETDDRETFFDMPIHGIPAAQFNTLFDGTVVTSEMRRFARKIRSNARKVTDLGEEAFLDAVRAHAAVLKIIERYDADAITIECLFLKHRKPCLSFALNNGALVPCGCENDLNATLTLMLGANLFGRGGFQHNPEFDTERNLYLGSHCTCTDRLLGPKAKAVPYRLRPFFHQLPKTLAVDVVWPRDESVTLCKYHSGENRLDAWAGKVVESPECPPVGGCATRVLVEFTGVKDVCEIYPGPHPILYCLDGARQLKTFAQLYELDLRTNG